MNVGKYAKAVVAALAAGSATLLTALGDGVVTNGEWVTVTLAILSALGVVYTVPNSEDKPSA